MSADFGRSSGILSSVIAVFALIVGGAGLYYGMRANKMQPAMDAKLLDMSERVSSAAQQATSVGAQIRQLQAQTQNAVMALESRVQMLAADVHNLTNALTPKAAIAKTDKRSDKPGEPTKPEKTGPGGTHAVKAKDSFEKIAKQYGIGIEALEKANPGVDSRRLKIGQKIKLPGPAAAQAR